MIRGFHLADLFTLANASCGMASVFTSMTYLVSPSIGLFTLAAALVPLALVFDSLDGRVARWRHAHSMLGRELDSLADVIAFGVAPAALAFAAGMRATDAMQTSSGSCHRGLSRNGGLFNQDEVSPIQFDGWGRPPN